MDYSLPDFSVYGILQARILEWEAISFSRVSSRPRNQTQVSCFAGRFFTIWATWEAPENHEIMINIINEAHICGGYSFSNYKIFADFLVLEVVYFESCYRNMHSVMLLSSWKEILVTCWIGPATWRPSHTLSLAVIGQRYIVLFCSFISYCFCL